jgi:hypothetical protein
VVTTSVCMTSVSGAVAMSYRRRIESSVARFDPSD